MKKLLTLLLLLSLTATFTGLHYRSLRSADRELLRLGVEDAAQTVRRMEFNLKSVNTVGEAAVLARARAVAELLARDRTYLEDQERLDSLCVTLEVDQIGVSDAKGVVIAASPSRFLGHDLNTSEEGRHFLPALTNRTFALMRPPCVNVNGRRYQYAGVTRRDSPGAVIIGFADSIVGGVLNVSLTARISAMRIGREGWLEAQPNEGMPPAQTSVQTVDFEGENVYVLETDCEGYRIRGYVPVHGSIVADDWPFFLTLVCDLLLILALSMSFTTALKSAFAENGAALALLFGHRASQGRYPLVVAAIAAPILLAVLFVYAKYEYAIIEREEAETLLTSINDIFGDLDSIPTGSLYLRAKAICLKYESPDALTATNVNAVAKEYGVDELNVVDSRRHIVATTMNLKGGQLPDMDARPETKIFNTRLLDEGAESYDAPFRHSVSEQAKERKYLGVSFERSRGGYVQVGYDRSRLRSEFLPAIEGMAHDWQLGRHGFFILVDALTGEIVSSGNEGYAEHSRLTEIPAELFAREKNWGKLRVIAATPRSQLRKELWENLMINAILLVAFAAIVVVLLGRLFCLVAELRHFINADKARRRQDLALARTIQLSSLPVALMDCERYKIFTRIVPAREVGGDFYDSYRLADGRVVITVADVSGKGVPAALFMMQARTALKSALLKTENDLAAAVAAANRQLCENNEGEMFVTAWIGIFNPTNGELQYVTAGHNPPLVKRRDGSVEWVRPRPSLVLAAMEIAKYRVERLTLASGDSLFVYTDGVTEAQNARGELFGEARLEATLKASRPLFVEAIGKAIDEFVAGAEPSDDITMLALDCKRIGGAQ